MTSVEIVVEYWNYHQIWILILSWKDQIYKNKKYKSLLLSFVVVDPLYISQFLFINETVSLSLKDLFLQ